METTKVRRAIGNMRRGRATPVDLNLIENKTDIIPSAAAKKRTRGRE